MKTGKRALSIILALLLLAVSVPFAFAEDTEDYTLIYTKEDLDNIRLNMSGKYKLMNDIIFTDDDFERGGDFYNSGKGWAPIGTETNKFAGTFDGNGKGIYYLVIHDEEQSNLGLFGFASDCTIMNCTLFVDILGNNNVGAVIGKIANATVQINNCRVKGNVKGIECVGGIVGSAEGTLSINNCFVNCQIEGTKAIGGIVGFNNCHSSAGVIQNSLIDGRIEGNQSTGGFVGDFYISSEAEAVLIVPFQNNENRAEIYGNERAGGLIGYVNSSYHHYTYTRIEYSQTYHGQTYGVTVHVYPCRTIKIINCMNTGNICGNSESESSSVGGLVGQFGGTTYNNDKSIIEKCYNVGLVEGSGLKGALTSGGSCYAVTNSNVYYWEDCISNATEVSGIMKSEDQLRKQSTYENWDFDTVWSINKDAEYRYPTLRGVSNQSEIVIPSNCQHKHTLLQNEKSATCLENGYTGDVVCEDCSETLEYGTVVPLLGHATQTYTTPSTCAENGFTITFCTRCGETLSSEVLPRLEHEWDDGVVSQEPTCTAKGVKTYSCQNCDASYTEPVDMLAHEWDDGVVTKNPSCTEAGIMTFTCVTGGETRTEPIDKLDHSIVKIEGTAPTCTKSGLTDGWRCETCQKWFAEQQEIDPLGHDPQIGEAVPPTCTEGGYTPFICTRCGETVSKGDIVTAPGHSYNPIYNWAADNSTVTASLVCSRCQDVSTEETVGVICKTVEASCTSPGWLTYTSEGFACKSFTIQTKTIAINQKPHATMQIREVSPTCTKEGVGSYWRCSSCNGIFEDEAATKPLTKPPVLPKLPHTPENPVKKNETPATCTESGSYDEVVYCSDCGNELSRKTIETNPLGHVDKNNDGECDRCKTQLTDESDSEPSGKICKYCGEVHTGFFQKIIGFFHSILALFGLKK